MKEVKKTGTIPDSHKSHDHLNEQKEVTLSNETFERWRSAFETLIEDYEKKGAEVTFGLLDGFLLYWDDVRLNCTHSVQLLTQAHFTTQEVVDSLDVRLFLRVPHDVLKIRRHERHGYHTAGISSFFLAAISLLILIGKCNRTQRGLSGVIRRTISSR